MADEIPLSRPSLLNRVAQSIESPPALQSLALAGLFMLGFLGLLYVGREVFVPLTLAMMMSFVFRPPLRWLERLRVPRAIAGAIVLVTVVGLLAVGATRLSDPAVEWVERLPAALRVAERKTRPLRRPVSQVNAIAERVEKITASGKSRAPKVSVVQQHGLAEVALEKLAATAGYLAVTLAAFYFMLVWGDTLLTRAIRLVPDLAEQRHAEHAIVQIERKMSQYLGTITMINLALGVAVGLALHAAGMPNPVLWGSLACVFNYVPYLGSLIGVLLMAFVSLVTFDGVLEILTPPAVYLAITTIEGQVLTPLVLGRTFSLNPLVIFTWLVFWAWLWGPAGALIAVPSLVLVKVTCEQSDHLRRLAVFVGR